MNRFIILFGSNFEAEKNILEARKRLEEMFQDGLIFSKSHWSVAAVNTKSPVSLKKPNRYLNAVCVGQTAFVLEDVLASLKKIETDMGRVRGLTAQEKVVVIDLDLVEWNGVILRPMDAAQDYYRVCYEEVLL